MFKSEEEAKEPPSEKELKVTKQRIIIMKKIFILYIIHCQEKEKRKLGIKQAELDRKKQHIDDEYQREKKRQEIRDKYGIQKKAQSSKDKQKVLTEMKKEYGMSDEEARELQQKMFQVCLQPSVE